MGGQDKMNPVLGVLSARNTDMQKELISLVMLFAGGRGGVVLRVVIINRPGVAGAVLQTPS